MPDEMMDTAVTPMIPGKVADDELETPPTEVSTEVKPSETSPVESVKIYEGVSFISRVYKDAGIEISSEKDEDKIPVQTLAHEVPVAHVNYQSKMTINMNNYESCQVTVGVTLPTILPQLDECFEAAKEFVHNKLLREVAEIKDLRDSGKSGRSAKALGDAAAPIPDDATF